MNYAKKVGRRPLFSIQKINDFQRLQKLFVLKILIKMKELVTLVKKIHKKFCSPIYVKLKRH